METATRNVWPRGNQKRAEREAAAWNKKHEPGLKVKLRRDDDEILDTHTRSVAWVVGGQAVILLNNVTGGYLLKRVTPAPDVT